MKLDEIRKRYIGYKEVWVYPVCRIVNSSGRVEERYLGDGLLCGMDQTDTDFTIDSTLIVRDEEIMVDVMVEGVWEEVERDSI